MELNPRLNTPQAKFLAMPHRFRALISGFGGGKTWAGCSQICKTAWEHPRVTQGYFGPTHSHTKDIFFPTMEEVAADWGFKCHLFPANREAILYYGRDIYSVIKCRSMDRPDSIVGFKLGRAIVDEIDTMPEDKAVGAWRKIIARLREEHDGLQNGADVTTTPEGFRFAYQTWVKAVRDRPELGDTYGMVQCSTYDNAANLPAGYIESLKASYPDNLIEAYLNGQFVNLQHGSVYSEFDRELNGSTETIQDREPIHIGMDFNVDHMAGAVHVIRNGDPHRADELVDLYDTPSMINEIKARYWKYEGGRYVKSRPIFIYPDSSGASRRSVGASDTDITLLKAEGFYVRAHPANPPVRDRLNSFNAMICNGEGKRRYFINAAKCPHGVECLEKQAYNDRGDPDKTQGYDHHNDASGYYVYYEYPLRKPIASIKIGTAL